MSIMKLNLQDLPRVVEAFNRLPGLTIEAEHLRSLTIVIRDRKIGISNTRVMEFGDWINRSQRAAEQSLPLPVD